MAKKNVRDEPLKPQVTENEQMSDIVLILDKMGTDFTGSVPN